MIFSIFVSVMKILLLGEYSNVFWTLAEGLRALGHTVTVASNGDFWKNYPRDIDLKRDFTGRKDTLSFFWRLVKALPKMRGYDVVQLVNPIFVELVPERIYPIYRYLRKHNKKVFLSAIGLDHYWVKTGLEKVFRYGDFNIGDKMRHTSFADRYISEWINGEKRALNKFIAEDCDGIISGLYEYDVCYQRAFPEKTKFIPFPINMEKISPRVPHPETDKIRFFMGAQKGREEYKGTDVMYPCLMRLAEKYPDRMEVVRVESVPYAQYCRLMDSSDVLLDQLYSYTPSMNSLLAMAKGLVLVGGGEEENYEILGETELRPIVNVLPNEDDIYSKLESLVLNPDDVAKRQRDSVTYVERYHECRKVAAQYVEFWNSKG